MVEEPNPQFLIKSKYKNHDTVSFVDSMMGMMRTSYSFFLVVYIILT